MTASLRPTSSVTAVIVSYQSARTLPACIEPLRRAHEEGLIEAVFVDNGSTDGTAAILQERAAFWAEVVLTGVNHGFGRGCNIGFARVRSPYTIFVNPDACVEPRAVETLMRFLGTHPEAGIAGPAIFEGEPGGSLLLQQTGPRPTPWSLVRPLIPWLRRVQTTRAILPGAEAFRTGWVCGSVLMIRTELMRRLGGFDPRFFLYWEEIDLSQRAEALGFQTWAVGAAEAHHVGGASSATDETRVSGCIARHFYQSRRYYLLKHHGWFGATASEALDFLRLCALTTADVLRGGGAARLKPRLQARLFSQPSRV